LFKKAKKKRKIKRKGGKGVNQSGIPKCKERNVGGEVALFLLRAIKRGGGNQSRKKGVQIRLYEAVLGT